MLCLIFVFQASINDKRYHTSEYAKNGSPPFVVAFFLSKKVTTDTAKNPNNNSHSVFFKS